MKKSIKPIAEVPIAVCGLVIFALFIFTSCSDNGTSTDTDTELTFESVIASAGLPGEFPESRTTDTLSVSEPEADDRPSDEGGSTETQRWICTTKTLSVLDGNGQFPLFNTNADVVYPGNLLQGKSLSNATPAPIVVERAGGTISYDLNNGNLTSTFTVDKVSKSSIQNAMNNIISNAGEVVPANFHLDIEEVQSEQQLALEMGLNVNTFATKVQSNMSFSTDRSYNRFLVKLTQSYYTMSFDLPTSLSQLFDESVTPEQLANYVQPDNPATFISSVTYGRIFYMLVESTSSSQEMEARLNISYGSFNNKASGSVDVDSFQEMNNVKIKVIAYGGDASGTFQLPAEPTIQNIADRLAESTDIRAGLPLSYVVRSVERPDKVVGTSIATEFDVVNCELKGTLPPVTFVGWVDLFDDGVGAATNVRDDIVILFNGAGTEYAWFHDRQIKGEAYNIADNAAPLGVVPFDAVGSALLFDDGSIYLMNKEGTKYAPYSFSPGEVSGDPQNTPFGQYSGTFDINNWGNNDDHPFAVEGMGAATMRINIPSGINYSMYLFNNNGDEYVPYEDGTFGSVTDFANWGPADQHEEFTVVGAATRIQLGSTEHNIFFNKEGDEFVIFDFQGNGGAKQFSQPYIIN
ncbi:MAG TPA: thiol-activated cytolysin family protein [Gracilimonas sp.]|uniref:thiol-activated cytolysin family protein n=1 Tax=Gracilimonas sp. TaxID=1974203 RepID=UPI002DB03963|nr:thiol-activated cytolysin family protein [Gracilimonas sp.]